MIGLRPDPERLHSPVSALAPRYGASATADTDDPDEAYKEWPGDYLPLRLPWPVGSEDPA